MKPTTVLCALSLAALSSLALAYGPEAQEPEPPLGLHFDFQTVDGPVVTDGTRSAHTARIEAGTIVPGRRKPAVQLAGQGQVAMADVPKDLDPTGRAFTVGAMCKPAADDGVILSMGDASEGFSLYLQRGVPQFAVRFGGVLRKVAAADPVSLDQWVHLAGVVSPSGELSLLVNTSPAGKAAGSLLAHAPAEPFAIGADPGVPVGDYSGPLRWTGLIQDVRLYWGVMSRETTREPLGDWADRPGCGCRKYQK